MGTLKKLLEFHEAFELPIGDEPGRPRMSKWEAGLVLKLSEELAAIGHRLHLDAKEDKSGVLLRFQLMVEELGEVADAVYTGDTEQVLHEMVDLRYVVDGSLVEWGMHNYRSVYDKRLGRERHTGERIFKTAFDRVHNANMSKLVDGKPVRDEAGRVQKPEGFVKATMEGLVR